MSALGQGDLDGTIFNCDLSGSVQEVAKDLTRFGGLESRELPRDHPIEPGGDLREDDIKVDLDPNGRTERVQVKEIHGIRSFLDSSFATVVLPHRGGPPIR